MKWLCILAAVTSFWIESKNNVTTDGALPAGNPTATYECTYKKGQMTKGHSATLSLNGWQDTEIRRMTLYMKSNKSSGGGTLSATVDGATVWSISGGSFETWTGQYSTNYIPVSHSFVPSVKVMQGDISIRVKATENSLYIERYEIEWTQAEAHPYTVVLVEDGVNIYAQLSEPSIGAGIVLPSLPDAGSWYFKGWSETPVSETNNAPSLLLPGTHYYPARDLSLYAVYSDYTSPTLDLTQRIDCQSGYYAIAFPVSERALEGPFEHDIAGIPTTDAPLKRDEEGWHERLFNITSNMIYYIDFLSDTTVQVIHANTNTYIGYADGKLAQNDALWRYRVAKDSTVAFYVPRDAARSRTLMAQYDATNRIWKGDLPTCLDSLLCNMALLYEADYNIGNTYWTSFPYGQSVLNTKAPDAETHIVQMGIYKLHIRNGKKHLFLGEMY